MVKISVKIIFVSVFTIAVTLNISVYLIGLMYKNNASNFSQEYGTQYTSIKDSYENQKIYTEAESKPKENGHNKREDHIYLSLHNNRNISLINENNGSNNTLEYDKQYMNKKDSYQILLWTPIFFENYKNIKVTDFCEHSNCLVTSNREKFNESDAVLFHWRNIDKHDIPAYHLPHQYWTLFNLEPPDFTQPGRVYPIMSDINWTMSYRLDSDIYSPYGRVVECNSNWKLDNNLFDRKTHSAVWASGHCKTESGRENLVNELSRYISVSKYGGCGTLKCEPSNSDQCYKKFADTYKFYLSFENSLCKDYVTEKLFSVLKYDMIPVVYGSANYSHILPENSYIDAMNFSSPKSLADFLKNIANDKNKYNSYLTWKSKYCVEIPGFISTSAKTGKPTFLCDLCKKLNTISSVDNKLHNNLVEWWIKDADCDYKTLDI